MSNRLNHADKFLNEGYILTHELHPESRNCLTQALLHGRKGHDEIVFLVPSHPSVAIGHIILRDITTGKVREPEEIPDNACSEVDDYSKRYGLHVLGAAPVDDVYALVLMTPETRAQAIAHMSSTMASIAHQRFGAPMEPIPVLPPNSPTPPAGGTPTNTQDKDIKAWLDALGGSVSQSDKDAIARTSDDARTLLNWFNSHKRGDPELNNMPKDVSDAENRLLSNPSINKQLKTKEGLVTRDTLNSFIKTMDNSAKDAKSSFQAFQKNQGKDASDEEVKRAAQDSILQAELPMYDAAGKGSSIDGKVDMDDMHAVADSDDDNLPDVVKQAANQYIDSAMFDTLASAGKSGPNLVDSDSFTSQISNAFGYTSQNSHIHDLLDEMGDAVSDKDKQSLEQTADDVTTLQNWFNNHDRGDPKLNDMPKDVDDAEKRLLSNPKIHDQITTKDGLVTRDELGKFLDRLNDSADSAKKDWDKFKDSDNADNPIAKQLAVDSTLLRAELPVFDGAAAGSTPDDNKFTADDLKTIASGDGSKGLPSVLVNAARLFGNEGMLSLLDTTGEDASRPHPDGIASQKTLDSFITKSITDASPEMISQLFSRAADRNMTADVDISKLGPDIYEHPENYTGAEKTAMIQQLQDLDTQVQAGVGQEKWVANLMWGKHINADYKQVQGDIAQRIASLSNDPDVQKFRQDNYGKSLQTIVQSDPALKQSMQRYYDNDVKNGDALKNALGTKDTSAEDAVSSYMQAASTMNLALGSDGKQLDDQIDFSAIANKAGVQDQLKQAFETDILSGKNLKEAIKNGTNMTTAIQDYERDVANLGAMLPEDYMKDKMGQIQAVMSDSVTEGTLDNASIQDIETAFCDKDGNVDTGKLKDAIEQAIKNDPDLGKDSNGAPLSTDQIVSIVAKVADMVRHGTKVQDALSKVSKVFEGSPNFPKPSGTTADAYNKGMLHVVSSVLTGGILAAKESGSSGKGDGLVDATRIGASMQIAGALTEAGTKYLKSTNPSFVSESTLKGIENAGKTMGGVGGALTGALGIFSGVEALKNGDKAGAGFGITNGITSTLSGIASAIEGGLGLTGVGGEAAASVAGVVSGALGIAGGVIGALSALVMGLFEGISAAVHNVQYTNQFAEDAGRLGITGGTEPSNSPDPDTGYFD